MKRKDIEMKKPKLTENMARIRIAWQSKIKDSYNGFGQWQPESERKNLMICVDDMNQKYPELKHWIENEK